MGKRKIQSGGRCARERQWQDTMKTAAKKGVTSPVKWRPCIGENGGRAEEKGLPKKGEKSGGSGTDTETETEGLSLLPHNLISAGQRPFAFQYPIRVKRWSAGGKTRTILEGAPFVLFFPTRLWPAEGIRFLSRTQSFWLACSLHKLNWITQIIIPADLLVILRKDPILQPRSCTAFLHWAFYFTFSSNGNIVCKVCKVFPSPIH